MIRVSHCDRILTGFDTALKGKLAETLLHKPEPRQPLFKLPAGI